LTALADTVPNHLATQYIPNHGAHGSSSLRADQNPAGSDENWKHVKDFLDKTFPKP
jgi:hypothetical protein